MDTSVGSTGCRSAVGVGRVGLATRTVVDAADFTYAQWGAVLAPDRAAVCRSRVWRVVTMPPTTPGSRSVLTHQDEFVEVFAQVLRLCARQDVSSAIIAIDAGQDRRERGEGCGTDPRTRSAAGGEDRRGHRRQHCRRGHQVTDQATIGIRGGAAATMMTSACLTITTFPACGEHQAGLDELDRQDAEHAVSRTPQTHNGCGSAALVQARLHGTRPSWVDLVAYHWPWSRHQQRYADLTRCRRAGQPSARARVERPREW